MANNNNELVIGDDFDIIVDLTKNGASFVIDPGATVQAVFRKGNAALSSIVSVPEANSGSDWPNSRVVVIMASAETETIKEESRVYLEIQVDDNGKQTWLAGPFSFIEGLIP